MILFNDVVEILDLADLDSRAMVGIVADDCRRVGAALVDRDLLRWGGRPLAASMCHSTGR